MALPMIIPVGMAVEDEALQLPFDEYRGLIEFIIATRKDGRIWCNYACEGFLGGYETEVWENFLG